MRHLPTDDSSQFIRVDDPHPARKLVAPEVVGLFVGAAADGRVGAGVGHGVEVSVTPGGPVPYPGPGNFERVIHGVVEVAGGHCFLFCFFFFGWVVFVLVWWFFFWSWDCG